MAKQESILDLPCAFGGVSFGDKTARVGVNVAREHLKLKVADDSLCDRRLAVTIVSRPPGDQEGQGRFDGMQGDYELSGTADVKGFSVHAADISFGLTFALKDLDRATLSEFPKRDGRMIVTAVEEIPEDADPEPEEIEPEPGVLPPIEGDEWKATPLRDALKGLPKKVYEGMERMHFDTIGKLLDWKNAKSDQWWTDIDGVGPAACDKIDDAIAAFVASQQRERAKKTAEKIGNADEAGEQG